MKRILLAVGLVLVGCHAPTTETPVEPQQPTVVQKMVKAVAPKPNPFSASELVKTHPRLQKICDKAGGCANVAIDCHEYDGTGNSNIRNLRWFKIAAHGETGDGWHDATPEKPQYNLDHQAVEQAISDWFNSLRVNSEMQRETPTIYPNNKPCDENCKP